MSVMENFYTFLCGCVPHGLSILTFLIIVGHVICNHVAKIQEEVPRVLGDRSLVMFLNATQTDANPGQPVWTEDN